ncbi:cytochrome P450 4d2-like [Anopheles maculipalpis]|uniref:cytochrome P450 4d2-like n=1 Tax=Anopheles maculipalpis TaxID=1496333 RepID=UPI002158E92B|nr:cytochrome P450 4d2-like [Anopheles maculipalpis]
MDSYLGLAQSKVKPRSVVDAFSNRTATIKKRPPRPAGTTSRPISTSSVVIDAAAQFRYLQEEHRLLLEKYKKLEASYLSLEGEYAKVKSEKENLQSAYEELQESYNNVTAKNFNAGKLLVYLKLKRRTDKETLEKRNIIKNEACFNTYLQDVVLLDHPRIPRVIHECITVLESNDKFMKSPGLYRVSGDHNAIQNLRYDINANNYKRLHKQKSPHEVCGILKLFLRELKDPLISLEQCAKHIPDVIQMKINTRSKVVQLIKSLDEVRQNTLKVLMKHLRNVAAIEENEVDAFSLGLLFSSLIFNETLADVCPVKFQKLTMFYWIAAFVVMAAVMAVLDWKLKAYENLPGPRRWPFIGNVVSFLGAGPVEIFDQLIAFAATYGKVYKLDFFYDYTIVYSSPEAAEAILNSPTFAAKSQDYDKVSEWIGNGLLISRGQKWFTHRKVITPGFHFKILENFVPVFNRQAEAFCAKMERLTEGFSGEAINIFPELKLLTLGIICETAMGVEMDGKKHDTQQAYYTQIVEELSSILYWRMFNVFVNVDALFRLTSTSRRFDELVKKSWNFTLDMIDKRRKINQLEEEKTDGSGELKEDEYFGKRKRALLDTLLEARIDGKPLTDEEIREEVDTFTFAGHDTTASAMTFILYNVAKHSMVQERIYQEIVNEIGTDFGELTLNSLNNLHYMELAIKESLRLFPPVPVIARIATGDTQLLSARITRGTSVAIDIFTMHHSSDYFPDAERFDPERFESARDTQTFNPYTYIPFSAGSRNCIGQKFAQYELKTTLVKLLQRFQIRLADANYVPTLKAEIVLKPAEGLPLKFIRRVI